MKCVTKSISPSLETLKAIDGVVQHLFWHQERFSRTRRECYNTRQALYLSSLLSPPPDGIYRVRVCYDTTVHSIQYLPYEPLPIQTIAIVESFLSYTYKYEDRKALNALIPTGVDDALIVEHNLLKDTTIANIALLIDGQWFTPEIPLLQGTTRRRLLESGFLKTAPLNVQSLQKADKFAIMNALIGFKIIENITIKDTRRVVH